MSSFSSNPFFALVLFAKFYVFLNQRYSIMKKRVISLMAFGRQYVKCSRMVSKCLKLLETCLCQVVQCLILVQQFKKTGESSKQKWHGRKPKLSIRQQRILGRMISANRKVPKQKILNEFNSGSEVKISMRTFERYSKKFGFRRRILGKKQVLRRKHRLARLSWVRTRRLLIVESYWKRIIFSDECTVKVGQNFRV